MEDEDIFTQMPAIEGSLVGSNKNLTVPIPEVTPGNTSFPQVLPGDLFPTAPVLSNPSAANRFLPFLLDEESYLAKYGTPTLSDEQIDNLYKDSSYKDERLLALSQFGFGLLNPTVGGKIGASLAGATQGLTQNLSQIKAAQKKEQKTNAQAKISLKLQQDAKSILDRKGVFDANRTLMTSIAGKDYDAAIAADKAKMTLYTDQMKAATGKFQDYQLDGVKPKRVQIRQKDLEGELGDPFDAFVVQSIGEDGILSAPQYYKPTNQIGDDGLPVMELIANPEGIIEVKTTITGTPEQAGVGKNVSSFLDIKGGLDVTDRALLTLDSLRESFVAKPNRAGFLAGIQKRFQTYSQIFADSYNYQFQNFFNEDKTLSDGTEIKAGDKFQSLSSTIDIYLQDPSIQEDIKNGVIDKEDLAALQQSQAAFDQLGVIGRAQMRAAMAGGKDQFGNEFFESEEDKQAIFKKLRFFDTELPANEVRANAIIYAIARSRKSSGRLNLDDIERAAKDLNIYGDSSADVIAKIDVITQELKANRADTMGTINLVFPDYYEKMIELGYGNYDRTRVTEILNNSINGQSENNQVDYSKGFSIGADGGVTVVN